jgi:membrane protein DedA with SNARE-associated domain
MEDPMTAALVAILASAGPWALVVLALTVFAETGILAGFFLPGDSLLFAAGVMTAAGVLHAPLLVVIGVVAIAAFLGDQLGYAIGRRAGRRVLDRPRRFLTRDHIFRAEAFFARHGGRAVILARFVPFARTLTPVLAGVGRMDRRTFVGFNLMGATVWASLMLTAGSLFGGVPLVAQHIDLVTVGLVALSLAPATVALFRHRSAARRVPEANLGVASLEHAA